MNPFWQIHILHQQTSPLLSILNSSDKFCFWNQMLHSCNWDDFCNHIDIHLEYNLIELGYVVPNIILVANLHSASKIIIFVVGQKWFVLVTTVVCKYCKNPITHVRRIFIVYLIDKKYVMQGQVCLFKYHTVLSSPECLKTSRMQFNWESNCGAKSLCRSSSSKRLVMHVKPFFCWTFALDMWVFSHWKSWSKKSLWKKDSLE